MNTLTGQVLSPRERAAIQKVANRYYSEATCEALIEEVAVIFKVSVDDIRGPSQLARLTDARTVISIALRRRGITHREIGKFINRDYSTITHHIQRGQTVADLKEMAEALS